MILTGYPKDRKDPFAGRDRCYKGNEYQERQEAAKREYEFLFHEDPPQNIRRTAAYSRPSPHEMQDKGAPYTFRETELAVMRLIIHPKNWKQQDWGKLAHALSHSKTVIALAASGTVAPCGVPPVWDLMGRLCGIHLRNDNWGHSFNPPRKDCFMVAFRAVAELASPDGTAQLKWDVADALHQHLPSCGVHPGHISWVMESIVEYHAVIVREAAEAEARNTLRMRARFSTGPRNIERDLLPGQTFTSTPNIRIRDVQSSPAAACV